MMRLSGTSTSKDLVVLTEAGLKGELGVRNGKPVHGLVREVEDDAAVAHVFLRYAAGMIHRHHDVGRRTRIAAVVENRIDQIRLHRPRFRRLSGHLKDASKKKCEIKAKRPAALGAGGRSPENRGAPGAFASGTASADQRRITRSDGVIESMKAGREKRRSP